MNNAYLEYQLLMMHHRELLAEAQRAHQVHDLPRRPSRVKLLWAAMRQPMGTLWSKKGMATRRPLRETPA